MIEQPLNAFCDICGQVAAPSWNDEGSKVVYCTDDYLRAHGYDPVEVGSRFAEMAKETFADFLNLPHTESEEQSK